MAEETWEELAAVNTALDNLQLELSRCVRASPDSDRLQNQLDDLVSWRDELIAKLGETICDVDLAAT